MTFLDPRVPARVSTCEHRWRLAGKGGRCGGQFRMEWCSLHPYDPETVAAYVAALTDDVVPAGLPPGTLNRARQGYARALTGSEDGANQVTHGLAQLLAATGPSYLLPGAGLTFWEARVDRGIGMLLRPPSRLFSEAGLDRSATHRMPIRLDASRGMMGGATVPPRLVPQLADLLETRLERLVRRMAEAELDAVGLYGVMLTAARDAAASGKGLYEAVDVVGERAGTELIVPDPKRLDPALRRRLEAAARPPKQPSRFGRLFGRGGGPAPNGTA